MEMSYSMLDKIKGAGLCSPAWLYLHPKLEQPHKFKPIYFYELVTVTLLMRQTGPFACHAWMTKLVVAV
jgi:hypothetical protein